MAKLYTDKNKISEDEAVIELHPATKSKAFQRQSNWFVAHVRPFRERQVARHLAEELGSERCAVFVPTKARSLRKLQTIDFHGNIVFSGYVFIATLDDSAEFYRKAHSLVRSDKDAIRLLAEAAGTEDSPKNEAWERKILPMTGEDKTIMLALLNEEYLIPPIEVTHEGERVVLSEQYAQSGLQGSILKIDRIRNSAFVEFDVFGKLITGWYPMIDLESEE
jgi:hypothetical protein